MNGRTTCRQWMAVWVGVLACLAIAQGQTVYTQGADLYGLGNILARVKIG